MQCFPIYSILAALNFPTVDYFSLDIEGAEYEVLKTIPFHLPKLKIRLMGIETVHAGKIFNGTENDITNFMMEHNFEFAGQTRLDKFFLRRKGNSKNEIMRIVRISPNFYRLHRQNRSQIV